MMRRNTRAGSAAASGASASGSGSGSGRSGGSTSTSAGSRSSIQSVGLGQNESSASVFTRPSSTRGSVARRSSRKEEPNVTLSQYSQLSDERDANFLIQFVIPNGQTKDNCSQKLTSAFALCQQYNLTCEWLDEKDFSNIIPMPGNIFVLQAFTGPAFQHLDEELRKSKNFLVIGPQCLLYSLQRNEVDTAIIQRGFPMFTLGMRGLVISLSGFLNRTRRAELTELIRKMGGFPAPEFTLATTHIVTGNVLTEKCAFAYSKGIPVMTATWVDAIWAQSQDSITHATDPEFVQFECPIFYNLQFCVSQVPAQLKAQLKKIITSCGGEYSALLVREKTNILIIPKGEGEKFKYSTSWKLPCLRPEWVNACKDAGHVVPMDEYRVAPVAPAPQPLSSTPVEHRVDAGAELPDMTSCSVIPDATATRMSRLRYVTQNLSNASEVTAQDLDEIKNAEPFLDGCKIYLCDSEKSEEIRKLLNGSGATRLNHLSESVTHIVVAGSGIPERDLQKILKLDPRPYIVGFQWLVESAKIGNPANEELFQFLLDEDTSFTGVQPPSAKSAIPSGFDKIEIGSSTSNSIQTLVDSRSRTRSGSRSSRTTNGNGGTANSTNGSTKNTDKTNANVVPGTAEKSRMSTRSNKNKLADVQPEPEVIDLEEEDEEPIAQAQAPKIEKPGTSASANARATRVNGTANASVKLPADPEVKISLVRLDAAQIAKAHRQILSSESGSSSDADALPRPGCSKVEALKKFKSSRVNRAKSMASESSLDSPRPVGPPVAMASSQTPQSQANETRKSLRLQGGGGATGAGQLDMTNDSFADCGSTDIDTSSDSPLYLGLPRKQSRILKKAFKIGCEPSPNTTIEQMQVKIPLRRRRSSTPVDSVIRQNLLAFAEQFGDGDDADLSADEMMPMQNGKVESDAERGKVADPLHSLNGKVPTKSSSNRPTTSSAGDRTTSPNENVPASRKRGSATTSSEEELESQAIDGFLIRKKSRTVVLDSLFTEIAAAEDRDQIPKKETSSESSGSRSGSGSGAGSTESGSSNSNQSSEGELNTLSTPTKKSSYGDTTSNSNTQSSVEGDDDDDVHPGLSATLLRSAERKKREKERLSQIRWVDGRTSPLTFIFTGLSDAEKSSYTKIILELGGRVNQEPRFSTDIDGVIAGTLARSEKVLCAMAYGKRILRPSYLTSSRAEGRFLEDPDGFLWGFGHGKNQAEETMATACAYWFHRIQAEPTEKPFSKFRALVFDNNPVKATAYKNLIIAGGGQVFDSTQLDKINVVICDSDATLAKSMGPEFTLPPGVARKLPLCLHEIIIKQSPPDDEFFMPSG